MSISSYCQISSGKRRVGFKPSPNNSQFEIIHFEKYEDGSCYKIRLVRKDDGGECEIDSVESITAAEYDAA